MGRIFAKMPFLLVVLAGIGSYQPAYMVRADEPASQPATQPAGDDKDHKDSEALEHDMKHMGKALKKLRSQINDATKNASSAELAADLLKYAVASKDQVPPMATSISADNRDKFIADYRDMIDGLIEQCKDLQQQLTGNKNDQAAQTLSAIIETMKEGHKEFRKPEHEDHGDKHN